jgi:hypothetical protein
MMLSSLSNTLAARSAAAAAAGGRISSTAAHAKRTMAAAASTDNLVKTSLYDLHKGTYAQRDGRISEAIEGKRLNLRLGLILTAYFPFILAILLSRAYTYVLRIRFVCLLVDACEQSSGARWSPSPATSYRSSTRARTAG